MREQLQ